jgi:hypothetical protein
LVLVASQGSERLAQLLYKFKRSQNSKPKQIPAATARARNYSDLFPIALVFYKIMLFGSIINIHFYKTFSTLSPN